jgi:hypothetical protein
MIKSCSDLHSLMPMADLVMHISLMIVNKQEKIAKEPAKKSLPNVVIKK